MSLRLASRRLALSGSSSSCLSPLTTTLLPTSTSASASASTPLSQRRSKWSMNPFNSWGSSSANKRSRKGAQTPSVASELDDPKRRAAYMKSRPQAGEVQNSIFQEELDAVATPKTRSDGLAAEPKTRENTALVADPDPRNRIRWQRRKVIQMVRRNGVLTKKEKINMTERQLLHKSPFMATSVKKLVMLARQIAGKNLDDAITQMTWSKKKFAAEIKYYLEEARDLAIAQRGMGLGKVNGEVLPEPRKIKTKEGRWIEVTDPTSMYIAQSWVGRGPWRGKSIDYKGRGNRGIIQHPSTSFTVVLKEEKTRLREYDEVVARKAARGPWEHLPNRPVYGQRPYYSW
ncbi:hypothetical protein E4U17_000550 [Claviceps sp. LM77 group G4]|nr:hypothetical protein E4U17_000550 [Claviceps sp. LM77 group G4]KAG6076321.1 hypothetical protein E4U16_002853 [Claviceps sp. LM84 group G4]